MADVDGTFRPIHELDLCSRHSEEPGQPHHFQNRLDAILIKKQLSCLLYTPSIYIQNTQTDRKVLYLSRTVYYRC